MGSKMSFLVGEMVHLHILWWIPIAQGWSDTACNFDGNWGTGVATPLNAQGGGGGGTTPVENNPASFAHARTLPERKRLRKHNKHGHQTEQII